MILVPDAPDFWLWQAGGKKFIRGADVVAKQEEEYRKKQKLKQANRRDSTEDEHHANEASSTGDVPVESTSGVDEIPLSEVYKRLRDRGQPIILFGEDEPQIRARLLKLEIEQPDMKEGWKNEMQTAMRDVDEELVKEVIEGSSNDPNKHDVDLSSSFNDNWEKIEEQATLLGVGNDPHRDCDIILSYFKYLITRWGMELNRRDDEEKKSPAGKLQASIHKQTVMNLKPLLNSLENHNCNNDIRHHLTNICRLLIIERNYILANNAYMTMAIGNAPWPVGVTRSGIHQRPGSAKAYVSNIAHVLNDETQRKYIQAFKRLMTRMQEMPEDGVDDTEMDDVDMDEVGEDLDEKIAEVRKKLEHNPYDNRLNNDLLSLLRKNGDFDELSEARLKISSKHPLSGTNWVEWIQDERTSGADRESIENLFEKATFDCNSLEVWMELVQWACGVDPKFAREKFEAAVSALGLRVDVGAMIWQSYLCFEEALLSGDETNEKQRKIVSSLYKRALRIPNIDLADTWGNYLQFAGEQIDEEIRAAYEASANDMKELSKYELKLAENEDSIDAFHEYLNYEKERGDPGRIQSFYGRMLDKHSQDENVWFDYGHWCETQLKVHSVSCRVYRQAVRHCPYSCALWQQTLLAMERSGAETSEIDDMWLQARETIGSADDGRALYRTYLYMLRRRADASDKDYKKMAELYEEGAQSLTEWFGKHDWDPQAQYRRNWAHFAYNKLNDAQKGRHIWDDILASGGGRFADKWIEAVRLERQFGTVEGARKLLYKALNSVSDHPTVVFEYFIQFEREEGTLEQLDKALEKVNAQAMLRASRQPQKASEETSKKKLHGKERHVDRASESQPGGRKRTNPSSDDAVPAKKQTHQESNTATAEKPVAKDKDGFAMPMLPVKKLLILKFQTATATPSAASSSDHPMPSVSSSDKNQKFTVFVSNLDFKTTPEQIKEVLDGVVEIRLVHRGMSKLTKGYGFVDLDSEESMHAALAKDRIPIAGRPMLVSISDPEKRTPFKYGTGLEKSKVFVRNVHYDCTDEQLREAFAVFGEVKAVRIVTHTSGKPKGVAYVEFAKEEDASRAVQAPEIILLGMLNTVSVLNFMV
ncbi:unnamed protein product [Nippostrongylus brasiliensis]|uniref:Pre-mRNA-splicing factor 18 n=1 Tax=Nippostrongylus brasiliensis TaxID=27835 RepID=A0A0N4XU17_NIPBR|nr:unnamed protein product [Nippostrongylus brasiliensis]